MTFGMVVYIMKIQLELSVLEYDLLLELVHKKYLNLDSNHTNLLICRDFSENMDIVENAEKELQKLEPSLTSFEKIWKQLLIFEELASSELAVQSASIL